MLLTFNLSTLAQRLTNTWKNVRGLRTTSRKRSRIDVVEALESRQMLTTFTVTTASDDVNPGDGVTSLREALIAANANSGGDTIEFSPAVNTAILTSSELVISDPVIIRGNGAFSTIIDGQLAHRVFNVTGTAGNVTFESLTIRNGLTSGAGENGAGINFESFGKLRVVNSIVKDSETLGTGSRGGGIFTLNQNVVEITQSDITGNHTEGDQSSGGGIYGFNGGALTITNSVITGNSTQGQDAKGGGLYWFAGSVSLDYSYVKDNYTLGSNSGGGGIYSKHAPVSLTNGSKMDANHTDGNNSPGGAIFSLNGAVTITDSVIENNGTYGNDSNGGVVYTKSGAVTITGSKFDNNFTGGDRSNGGAIATDSGNVTIDKSQFFLSFTTGASAEGGALFAFNSAVTIRSSTISSGFTQGTNAFGAGIRIRYGNLFVFNSTIAYNFSYTDGGGGISLRHADLLMVNSTVSGNNAQPTSVNGGGGIFAGYGSVSLFNSIIAGNTNATAPDLAQSAFFPGELNINNSLIGNNLGTNLVPSATPNAQGNIIGTNAAPIDPVLGPLQSNGGPTPTKALLNSPAVNTGNNEWAIQAGLTLDQNENPRFNGTVDMGAFELQTPTASFSVSNSSVTEFNSPTILVTVTLSQASPFPVTIPFSIGGTASNPSDYTIAASPLVIPAGQTSGTIQVNIVDNVSFEPTETIILTFGSLTNANPGAITSTTINILDIDSPPVATFSTSTQSVGEGVGLVAVTVNLSFAISQNVTIPYSIGGSATNTTDYTIPTSPLVIPAGQSSATFLITVIDDTTIETDENVILTLGTPTNASLGSPTVQTITILENDFAPVASFSLSALNVNENVGSTTLTVNLSKPALSTVSIPFTVTGTASNGGDFNISASPLVIQQGATFGTITLNIVDDATIETNETVIVTLGNPTNATLGATTAVTLTIADNDNNTAPTIPANQTFTINENLGTGNLVGVVTATDADPSPPLNTLTFTLSNNPSNAFAINPTTGALTVADSSALDFETSGSFNVGVTVTDGGKLSATQSVRVNLTNVNEAPSINANQSFFVPENSTAGTSLGNVGTTDPDTTGSFASKTFSLTSNPNGLFAINASTGQITVASGASLDFETATQFTLGVTVTDGGNLSASRDVVVRVTDVNEAPTITAGQTYFVFENPANGTAIGTVTSTDPDTTAPNNTKSFNLNNNPSGAFAINASTGQITVANGSALTFTKGNQYTIGVTVTDGRNLSASQNVTVIVTDVNQAPTIPAGQTFNVPENSNNGTTVGTVNANDTDVAPPFNVLTFSLTSNPSNAFSINSASGVITVANQSALDFETFPTFNVGVKVTDGGNLFANQTVTIFLNNVNETPSINANQSFTVAENSNPGTVLGTVIATDPDTTGTFATKTFSLNSNPNGAFAINSSTGQITVATSSALNFEASNQLTVGVTVTDGGNLFASQTVTVNITDANETPTLTPGQSFNVAENATFGTAVGTVSASDPDTTAPNNTRSFSLSGGNTGNAFTINSATGQITVASPSSLNSLGGSGFNLSVTVTDGGGLSATQSVAIFVIAVNQAPTIPAGQSFSINENSPNNTVVGTVVASDSDVGDTLTYSITSGNTGNAFSINSVTGQLRVANSATLDFETSSSFELLIKVTDAAGLFFSRTVTIDVNNVNEAPTLSISGGASTFIKAAKQPVTVISQVTVGDTDTPANLGGGTLTLSARVVGNKKFTKYFDAFSFPGIGSIGSGSPQISGGQLTLQIQLNPNVTANAIQNFLKGISFSTTGAGLKSLTRSLSITLADAGGLTAFAQQTINVRKK